MVGLPDLLKSPPPPGPNNALRLPLPRARELTLYRTSRYGAHSYSLKEEVPVPRGWTRGSRAPTTHHIDLRIGLPQGDFAALESHLWEISDRACGR
jgi:hypothetical protein